MLMISLCNLNTSKKYQVIGNNDKDKNNKMCEQKNKTQKYRFEH